MSIGIITVCKHCGRTIRKSLDVNTPCPRCNNKSNTRIFSIIGWILFFIGVCIWVMI